MTDYYLKFADEAQAAEVLKDYQGSVDIIGEIPDIPGWHVNVRGDDLEDLLEFSVEPKTPQRVWL